MGRRAPTPVLLVWRSSRWPSCAGWDCGRFSRTVTRGPAPARAPEWPPAVWPSDRASSAPRRSGPRIGLRCSGSIEASEPEPPVLFNRSRRHSAASAAAPGAGPRSSGAVIQGGFTRWPVPHAPRRSDLGASVAFSAMRRVPSGTPKPTPRSATCSSPTAGRLVGHQGRWFQARQTRALRTAVDARPISTPDAGDGSPNLRLYPSCWRSGGTSDVAIERTEPPALWHAWRRGELEPRAPAALSGSTACWRCGWPTPRRPPATRERLRRGCRVADLGRAGWSCHLRPEGQLWRASGTGGLVLAPSDTGLPPSSAHRPPGIESVPPP
jgi:hypothetical protein